MACPDDNTLAAMIENALDEAALGAIEAHLDTCPKCRTVTAMAMGSRSLAAGTPHGTPDAGVGLDRDPEGLVGSTIHDRYHVSSLLGRGGMGTVYLARDASLDRDIALKVHRHGTGNVRLQREAVAMAQLAHPNVVAVFEVGIVDTWMYVAMEYVRGVTLREWVAAADRPWREVLAMVLDAGRGLAAAHASGLIHRDFKPENVLVGDDARPRVSDFGLARVDQATEAPSAPGAHDRGALTAHGHATQEGTVLGTPAYMAPEQFSGGTIDARCDQFAFAVVVWECLYGRRPFTGSTMLAVQLAIENQQLQRPGQTAVPHRVRRAIERALAVAAVDRYPDMPAFLAELRRVAAPRTRRRIAIASVVTLAVLGAAIPIGSMISERRQVAACEREGDAVRRVFDPAARLAVQRQFTASPEARTTFDKLTAVLDRHTEALAVQTAGVCRSAGEPARRACVAERKGELAALVASFAHADASLVQRAADSAWAIFDPTPCDEDHLARASASRSPIHGSQLGRLKALGHAGQYREGVSLGEALLAYARRTGERSLELDVLFTLGQLRSELDAPDVVAPVFHAALAIAEALGRDLDAAASLEALANLAGVAQHDYVAAHRYIAHARAKLERLGDKNLVLEAKLLSTEAQTFVDENRLVESEPIQRRAVATLEAGLGGNHPSVGAMYGTLSQILRGVGKRTDALAASQRALQILEPALGPDHPTVAGAHMTLAQSLIGLEQLAEARVRMLAADQVFLRVYGAGHPVRAAIHANLGELERMQRRWEPAVAAFRVALGILEQTAGPDSPGAAAARRDLAVTLAAQGKLDDAASEAERSLAITEKLGPAGPRLGPTLVDLADIQLARAHPELAAPLAERALALATRSGATAEPGDVGAARFSLARALVGRDRPRARHLAELARTGAADPETRATIEGWLAEHPPAVPGPR